MFGPIPYILAVAVAGCLILMGICRLLSKSKYETLRCAAARRQRNFYLYAKKEYERDICLDRERVCKNLL